MEEIICPECGRPNLSEAAKCWYCQKKFEKKQEFQDNQQQSESGNDEQPADTETLSKRPETQEEIPEWLSRVRELKMADEEIEEQRDQWQQEALFSNKQKANKLQEKKKTRKIAQKKQSTRTNSDGTPLEKKAAKTEHALDEKESRLLQDNVETDSEIESSDELPEGFKPLSHDNEDVQTNLRE